MGPVPPNTARLKLAEMPAGAVIFTHIDDKTGVVTTYSITHLWQAVQHAVKEGLKPSRVHIDRKFAKFVREERGIERYRLNRIKKKHLNEPVLFATQFDGSNLLIDGSHRYVKAANLMQRTIPAFILPPEVWYPFTMEDEDQSLTSDDLLRMKSGIS